MLPLFPKIRNRMIVLTVCYVALVIAYLVLNPAANPIAISVVALIGLAIVLFSQYLNVINTHSRLLAMLYNQLDVEGFLRQYEPMLNYPVKNRNVALSVRLHLSNAYCAQGRFDDAMALLNQFEIVPGKNSEDDLLSRFAIVSNLCYFAEQKNDLPTAKAYMADLLALKSQLEALQEGKPMNKRMVFNTDLNEQCMAYLTDGETDIEMLQKLIQNNTQQLHRITISLWLAKVYLKNNNRREAEKLLTKIAKLAPDLYPGQTATQILADLPGAPLA